MFSCFFLNNCSLWIFSALGFYYVIKKSIIIILTCIFCYLSLLDKNITEYIILYKYIQIDKKNELVIHIIQNSLIFLISERVYIRKRTN